MQHRDAYDHTIYLVNLPTYLVHPLAVTQAPTAACERDERRRRVLEDLPSAERLRGRETLAVDVAGSSRDRDLRATRKG